MRTTEGTLDWTKIINIVQAMVITVMIPFTVYYVNNYAPYVQDKRYIEQRLSEQDNKIDRIIYILDTLTELQLRQQVTP